MALLHQAAMQVPPEAQSAANAFTPSPEVLEAAIRDGNAILLRSGIFDPATSPEPDFTARGFTAREPAETDAYLVQFDKEVPSGERASLESPHLRFVDTIPSRAYIVRADREGAQTLSGHPWLRWMGLFRGGYKPDPVLLAAPWRQPVFLEFRLFPEENPFLLLARLQAMDPRIDFGAVHGDVAAGATLRILVPGEDLPEFLPQACEDPAVWSVEPWFLPHAMNDNSAWVVQSYDTTNRTTYSLSATMWNHGLTGTGQTPAVCDTGCDDDMCFFRFGPDASAITDAQTVALPGTGTLDVAKKVVAYYVLPNATAYDGNATCASTGKPQGWHGTHVCGSLLGDNYAVLSTPTSGGHDAGDGMAPNARLIFQDAGNETTGCLDGLSADFSLIFQQAYNAGARIHSDSWGADTAGVYNGGCQTVDRFIYDHEDFLIFFSNGNAGPGSQTVGYPASAKNCLALGATTNGSIGANSMASYSSRGPTADGRRKPDLCAPGSLVVSASGTTSHTDNNCSTKGMSGTSMATPTAAGAASLLRQYFTDGFYPTGAAASSNALQPSAALLKAALINGAVDIANTTQGSMLTSLAPDNNQGFGRVALDTVAFFSSPSRDGRRVRLWDRWNATGLQTGEQEEFPIQVASGQPLKITLVWTDPQSSTTAAVNLINNLDLEVVAPDGSTTYKGNVFASGQSAPGGFADLLNNVEEVFLTAPPAGTWTLRVKASAVPGAPSQPTSGRQGFALVATYADCATTLPAPASLAASDSGSAGINLSWPEVPGAGSFQIYRASGDCFAAAAQFHYVAQTAGLTFTDALVQGGYDYAYKVRAVDGCNEGAASPCATATSSGNCGLIPTFAGIASAANDPSTGPCDTILIWSSATSNCPLGNTVRYNVYRGATPYFVAGPSSRVATGVTNIYYRDTDTAPNTTYYYIVRAEDGTTANGGPANGGNEDTNAVMAMATPTAGTFTDGTWADTGGDGYRATLALAPPWRVTNQQNHTEGGSLSYHAGPDGAAYPAMACAAATTPSIPLQGGQAPRLTFWERHNLEYLYDGVIVEISDSGGVWSQLALTPDYPGALALTGSPPINACADASTVECFTGPYGNTILSPWKYYAADLTAFAGLAVRIRWRLTTDPATESEGFYLDDIQITYSGVPDDCLVRDGVIALDKNSYRCEGGAVEIRVTDSDLVGAGFVDVAAKSAWETSAETVLLPEVPAGSGRFRGILATTAGAPAGDGLLSIRNGDTITATYVDADDGRGGASVPKTATATADCVFPVISGVSFSGITPTSATVTWTTDESANSRVTFGTSAPPGTNMDDLFTFTTAHGMTLTGLTPCTAYTVSVTSADPAGNTATDDRGGTYYPVTTRGTGIPPACAAQLHYAGVTLADTCNGAGAGGGDGTLDPGEDALLLVTLSNDTNLLGQGTSGITATLTSDTPGVTVTRDGAAFPDVPSGGTGTSIAPHFGIHLARTVSCGTPLDFLLRMVCAQGVWDEPFSLTAGSVDPGTSNPINEGFTSGDPPAGWSVADGGTGTQRWTTANPGGIAAPSGITPPFESINSNADGMGFTQDDSLVTPTFDASGATSVVLSFDTWYRATASSSADVEVSRDAGATWPVGLAHWTTSDVGSPSSSSPMVYDITSATGGSAQAKVRFRYAGGYAWYWLVDNVRVDLSKPPTCTVNPCTDGGVQVDASLDPASTLVQLCGNGDNVVEPGEAWQVTVRLKNWSAAPATGAQAALTLNSASEAQASVPGGPAAFGTIPGGGTATAAYTFIPDPATPCNRNLVFDVTGIQTAEGSHPDQIPAFTVQVGGNLPGASETATQATNPLNASAGAATSLMSPALALVSPDSASLLYTGSYTPPPVTSTLFGPDDMTPNISNWSTAGIGTAWTAGVPHCAPLSNGFARVASSSGTAGSLTLTNPVSTAGCTNIHVKFACALKDISGTPQLKMDWTDGVTWTHAFTFTPSTTWSCSNDIALPTGAAGKAGFKVRFTFTQTTAVTAYGFVDGVTITGDSPGPSTWTTNARVSLVNPSNGVSVLKAYGAADGSPYDVKPFLVGPGAYQLRIEENSGGTATLTGGTLQVILNPVVRCTQASCGGLPEEAAPGGTPATAQGWSGKAIHTWPATQGATSYKVYRGIPAHLPKLLDGQADSCTKWTGTNTTCPVADDPSNIDGRFYWYLVTALNGNGEGTTGSGTTASRVLNSTGPCL
jgi:hypothetical protein